MILFLSVFDSIAQSPWCVAKAPTQTEKAFLLQKFQAFESQRARMSTEGVRTVALKVHILKKNDGQIEFSEPAIKELVDTLNFHFIKAGIQFYLCSGVEYISHDNYDRFAYYEENALCNKYDVNNAINLYLVAGFLEQYLGGYARLPDSDKYTNRIFCSYANPHELITKILPHEMGHYFGLLHTFEGAGSRTTEEFVTRGEQANCSYRGDLICDTPADPFDSIDYTIGNCTFSSNAVDPNGDKYTPQLGNLMSYYRGCGNFFTPGQIAMIKTGLLIRLIPHTNKEKAYSINCQGDLKESIVMGDVFLNGKRMGPAQAFCVDDSVTVTFSTSGNFDKDNEFKAYIISGSRNYAAEIGTSKTNSIVCKVPKDISANEYYYIKVEATKPDISGTLSYYFYYVAKPLVTELSGEYEVFAGEEIRIPVKSIGGVMQLELENNLGNYYINLDNSSMSVPIKQDQIIKIKRSSNACGEGINKGQVAVKVVPKPLANWFIVHNFLNEYICHGALLALSIQANGVFEKENVFKAFLSDSNGENFKELEVVDNGQNLINLKIPDNLPEGSQYRLNITSSNPALQVSVTNLTVYPKTLAVLSGDTTIVNGKQALLNVHLEGQSPFLLETTNGQLFTVNENNFKWAVSPAENTNFSLKSVSSDRCGNGKVSGNALVKVDFPLKTSILKFSSACAGSQVKLTFENQNNVPVSNNIFVQLSDSKGKNFKNIPGTIEGNTLTATIPNNTPEGLNYRLRVISKDGLYIGNESNEFEVKRQPTAVINQSILGNKNDTTQLIVKLTGGGPWNFPLRSANTTINYSAVQTPFYIPVTLTENKIYQLASVTNACGAGIVSGQAQINVREGQAKYCIPKVVSVAPSMVGQISQFRLTDAQENILINNFELSTGKDFYTDNTSITAKLKPGNTYSYRILASETGTEADPRSVNPIFLIMWIDYNQNGEFEKNESIVENALEFSEGTFTVPENVKKGITRLRIRGFSNPADQSRIPSNPCLQTVVGGETEDYTINMTDEVPDYSIQTGFNEIALCKNKEYGVPFTYMGNFSENNVFRVAMYNNFGQLVNYLGEGKTSPIKISFPDDIAVGYNYKLKIIASDLQRESSFTQAFRINDIPRATLSGNQSAYVGEKVYLNLTLDGGADWAYSLGNSGGVTLNYILNKIILSNEAYFGSASPKPGTYYFKVGFVYNTACEEGIATGEAKVELREPDKSAEISTLKVDFWGYSFNSYYQCAGNQMAVNFSTKGKFNKDNFFSCHLIGPNDEFVADLGIAKTNQVLINIPKNIEGFGYKLKIVSSSPYMESSLSKSFTIIPKMNAKLSGDSEIMPGEQALIKLELAGSEPWEVKMSDGTSFVTNLSSQYLKVSPKQTQTYSLLSVRGTNCNGDVSGAATVKVLKPRATRIALKQINEICIGAEATAYFQSDGSFRDRNDFKLYLTNKQGNLLKDITARIVNDSTLNFTIPDDVPPGKDYSLKLITTSPYLESAVANIFTLKLSGTATISSDIKSVYEKTPIRLRVDFTGEGPYTIELSDSSKYENITQNPYFIDLKATLGINKYTIRQVLNSCGKGKISGSVELNIIPLPIITTERLPVSTVCPGNRIFVPFKITRGVFLASNVFKVELLHIQKNKLTELQTIIKGDSLFAFIPNDATAGVHSIRVNGSAPLTTGSFSTSELVVRSYPTATIAGNSSVLRGDSTRLQLTFTGDSPWNIRLSNGIELQNIIKNPLAVTYLPQKSETITISSVKNACGEGSSSGNAVIEVLIISSVESDETENQVEIYPIPFEQSTSLYIAPALLKQAVDYELSDILGRVLIRKPVLESQTPIDLNFYPSGIYYVRVKTNGRQFLRKIVK